MREKILFDEGWMFHRGEISRSLPKDKGSTYSQAKTERMQWGPAARNYKGWPEDYNAEHNHEIQCENWEWVNLPHEYVIAQVPSKEEDGALGFFRYENAWYRKLFFLAESDRGRRITLLFEGVATHATVYLNGCLMKHNFCGYNSFEVDISDVLRFREGAENENVLAVYVETDSHEGWWYEGGGIYRHVWLYKTEPVAIDLWGVYAMPKLADDGSWRVDAETTVVNDRYEDVKVRAVTVFYDAEHRAVVQGEGTLEIPFREKGTVRYSMSVENPILWDLENPYLYTVETQLFEGDTLCDRYCLRTGFRSFTTDADKGLFLNGKHIKIQGVCAHQDFGLTGKAVPDNIHRYKIEMLKEMGANGYRTSHYPHTEAVMDALDELGFIVMDETRWFESTDEGKQQLEMLVRRD